MGSHRAAGMVRGTLSAPVKELRRFAAVAKRSARQHEGRSSVDRPETFPVFQGMPRCERRKGRTNQNKKMNHYDVVVREVRFGTVIIKAHSIDEAKTKVLKGEGDFDEQVDWDDPEDATIPSIEMIEE